MLNQIKQSCFTVSCRYCADYKCQVRKGRFVGSILGKPDISDASDPWDQYENDMADQWEEENNY